MKTLFLQEEFTYDGTQLRSLFAYLGHGLLGDSVVAWRGGCEISFDHMVDGEDLREQAAIRGSRMLHLIFEIFDRDLFAGVALQRLTASIAKDLIEEKAKDIRLKREGDDLYWNGKKLSISIATRSPVSTMVHFAMNLSNAGTPVPTCALEEDFGLETKNFASELLRRLESEYESILDATRKVRPVP